MFKIEMQRCLEVLLTTEHRNKLPIKQSLKHALNSSCSFLFIPKTNDYEKNTSKKIYMVWKLSIFTITLLNALTN